MPRAKASASLSFGRRFLLLSPGEADTIAEDGEAFPRMSAAAQAGPREISGRHVECTPCSTVNNSVIPVV
jgi:hypothetical protein